ncbi:MAG: M48 family metalloprotease [Planctomycetota bacterium]
MAIAITCAGCGKSYRVKDEFAGRKMKCPACSAAIPVPAVGAAGSADTTRAQTTTVGHAVPTSAGGPRKAAAVAAAPVATPAFDYAAAAAEARPGRLQSERATLSAVIAGFQGDVGPRRLSPIYLVGMLFTTLVMVALPLIYVAIIALVCWAVYWHMVNDYGMVVAVHNPRAVVMLAIVYAAPLVIGMILIVFMIKPLLAPLFAEGRRRSITRKSEPVLFALVDKICETIHAPPPKRIDIDCQVNAGATTDGGWLGILFSHRLVLKIGMPLVAGLTVEQFAGVLAHEFGHFSQRIGRRLNAAVGAINFWLVRAVYERDAWDAWLAETASEVDFRIGWVLALAMVCVWITRRVLWVLMMLGHLVAGFMLRQMEYNADSYEYRLVGSKTFESTGRRLVQLEAAHQCTLAILPSLLRDGRLPDDLPKLMMANLSRMPDKVRLDIEKSIEKIGAGVFDSHPAIRDRIAAARRANIEGIFRCDLPAECLFSNFAATTRNVTFDLYCEAINHRIKPTDLCPVEMILAAAEGSQQADK